MLGTQTEPGVRAAAVGVGPKKKETMEETTERLRNFQPIVVGKQEMILGFQPMGFDILGFDDNGRTTFIPRTYDASRYDITDWFKDNGKHGVVEVEMSEAARERYLYCTDVLKLPNLVATHLTFNEPERDLSEFFWPGKVGERLEGEVPTLIGSWGKSGEGKSTFVAAVALKEGAEIANFDVFSKKRSTEYLAMMRENGLNESSSIEEIHRFIKDHREELVSTKSEEEQSCYQALHNLTNIFVGGYRPEVVMCDFPGFSEESRPTDIFDMVAYYSMSSYELMRNPNYPFEESIKAYLKHSHEERAQLMEANRIGEEYFRNYVNNPEWNNDIGMLFDQTVLWSVVEM